MRPFFKRHTYVAMTITFLLFPLVIFLFVIYGLIEGWNEWLDNYWLVRDEQIRQRIWRS